MKCLYCGGTVTNDNCQNVCEECGCIQDTNYLVGEDGQQTLASTFAKFGNDYKGRAYAIFKTLFNHCTLVLETPTIIIREAELLLPKLWDDIKSKHYRNKQKMILALLFLLYRKNNLPMISRRFLGKAHVWYPTFGKAIQYIRELFTLPDHFDVDLKEMIRNEVSELVKVVFKESNPTLVQKAEPVALHLANVVHDQEWESKASKLYVSHVACAVTILAAQYACSSLTTRKTKAGDRASFRFRTINLTKVCEHGCAHVRMVRKVMKNIQTKLFAIMKDLPCKLGNVTTCKHVPSILKELLEHADLSVENDNVKNYDYPDFEVQSEMKLTLLRALSKCILKHPLTLETSHNWVQTSTFRNTLLDELLKTKNDSNEQHLVEVLDGGHLVVSGCQFMFGQLELLRELLMKGCTLEEVMNNDSLSLVQKYLDSTVSDDEELEEMSDNESSLYLKDVESLKELNKD